MARRKKRLVDSGGVVSPGLPERFYHLADYFDSHGPMTPSAFRAYTDDLRDWLESEQGVSKGISLQKANDIIRDINALPSVWLDLAAEEGAGYREWKPAPVEDSEPLMIQPESDPDVVVPVKSTYEVMMEQIRSRTGGQNG